MPRTFAADCTVTLHLNAFVKVEADSEEDAIAEAEKEAALQVSQMFNQQGSEFDINCIDDRLGGGFLDVTVDNIYEE